MNRYLSTLVVSLMVCGALSAPVAVRAQDSDLAGMLYSQGVESFFDGRATEAESYLSRAIATNPDDPRPIYFRALCRLRESRSAEARADMQSGAELEARLPNRFAMGKVLERVQGPDRLTLEQYRRDARLRSAAGKSNPVQPLSDRDGAVLRERRIVPLEEFLQPGAPRAVAVQEPVPTNTSPPAAPATLPTGNKKLAPATQADPFSDEPAHSAPAATKAPSDPFNDEPAQPGPDSTKLPASKTPPTPKTPPPVQPAPTKVEDPFQ